MKPAHLLTSKQYAALRDALVGIRHSVDDVRRVREELQGLGQKRRAKRLTAAEDEITEHAVDALEVLQDAVQATVDSLSEMRAEIERDKQRGRARS